MAGTIRNPIEWGYDQLHHLADGFGASGRALGHIPDALHSAAPVVTRIGVADIRDALKHGYEDFGACRTDVIFLCAFYPIVGFIAWRAVFGAGMLPLLFPLAAGFSLLGPLAAVGLLEISRQREQGREVSWATAFDVLHSPSIGAIALLGFVLMMIFFAWILSAELIYGLTLGPAQPVSLRDFMQAVFTTERGWTMIVVGMGVGFLFAILVLSISVVSFALLLDRVAGIDTAIRTSVRVVTTNPGTMALWGLVIAGGLVLGSLPLFVGLVVIMPLLGHATWHLYRKAVWP